MPTGDVENTAMNIEPPPPPNISLPCCTMSLLTTAKIAVRGLGHITLPPIAESY